MGDEFISLEEAERLEERERRGNGRASGEGRFRLEPFDSIDVADGPEWLIEGIVPALGLTVLYGEPGCGKSFLAADMGLAVAQGRPWGGRAVKPGAVVYVSAEGATGFRKRIVAYREHHGIADVVPFYLVADCPDLGSRPGDAEALARAISEQVDGDVALVELDTVARTMTGADENSTADMGTFIHNCAIVSDRLGCAVLAVHHSGKDATKGARGSTALKAAADAEIFVSGDGHRRTATLTKSKDGEGGFEFAFRLDRFDFEAHGRPVSSCILEPLSDWATGAREDSTERRLSAVNRIALDALALAASEATDAAPASNHIPAGVRAIRDDTWRRYFYAKRTAASEEARKKSFQRARDELQARRAIGAWGEWVWAV